MEYERKKLNSVFKSEAENKLVLPDFQRDFVWSIEKQSNLLASILVGLPIGSFLIIEGKKNDFPARRLGCIDITEPKEECNFLLDGQQRLSCLKSIFDNFYTSESWKDIWDRLYGKLRNRWFLKILPSENSEDIFGWKKLRFLNELDTYDPDQVLDFIVPHKILVKGETNNDWYHPAYKISDQYGNEVTGDAQRRNLLANEYASKNLVPLFEIYSNAQSTSLHNMSLREIANKRRESLKAEVEDGKLSIEDVLGHIDPNISNINDPKLIDGKWYELSSNWTTDVKNALEALLEQEILETVLPSSEIARAASIFETINEGGTPLSNFDLIVAKTAKTGGKSLVQILKEYIEQEIIIPSSVCETEDRWKMANMKAIQENSIVRFVTDQFLNLISILCYQKQLDNNVDNITLEHIKQSKILKLESIQINNNFIRTVKSLRKAFAFLQYRCGIVEVNDIGYKLMILPIAYLFSLTESNEDEVNNTSDDSLTTEQNTEDVWSNENLINKIEYWYWSSLFSGRYKEKQNERCIQDVQYLYHWVINDKIDDDDYNKKIQDYFQLLSQNIFNKQEYSDRSTLLMENDDNLPQKGIKYAILQYILSKKPKDFTLQLSNQDTANIEKLKAWEIAQENKNIEEHHIIPLSSATSIGESTKNIRSDKNNLLNSPLNLTYLSKEANRAISDLSPDVYLQRLTAATLTGHEISPSLINKLVELNSNKEFNSTTYKLILEERFNTLKRTIETELELLIEQD
jgi:hypothetical protein